MAARARRRTGARARACAAAAKGLPRHVVEAAEGTSLTSAQGTPLPLLKMPPSDGAPQPLPLPHADRPQPLPQPLEYRGRSDEGVHSHNIPRRGLVDIDIARHVIDIKRSLYPRFLSKRAAYDVASSMWQARQWSRGLHSSTFQLNLSRF